MKLKGLKSVTQITGVIYGEGQRAEFSEKQIFKNWNYIPYKDFPQLDDEVLGCDFGY